MNDKKRFGLIGRNISYSFSKKFFAEKFLALQLPNHTYDIFDLPELESLPELLKTKNLRGLNVTIPYKEKIIPYLDQLSDEAAAIGAVNTISITENRTVGYNTDAYGFEKTLFKHKKAHQNSALILGDGGAAKAVKHILQKHGIPFETVSRSGKLTFENLAANDVSNHLIIIQCTPVGTFPNVNEFVHFPFESLSTNHLVIDLIYNPPLTCFLKKAGQQSATVVNGSYMLEQQAEKAAEIWNIQKK